MVQLAKCFPYKIDPLNLGIDDSLAGANGSLPNWLSIHELATMPLGFDDFLIKYIAMITMTTAIPTAATPPTTAPAIVAVATKVCEYNNTIE